MSTVCDNTAYTSIAKEVIQTEIDAINELIKRVDHRFEKACQTILNTKGRVVVIGMGKSGHIANKIAATLASTGTPAFFVHPSEASHGDIGMILDKDCVIAISNSGETGEMLNILPLLKHRHIPIISLCGRAQSTLATAATVNLDISVSKEACPLGLAPTSSTTTTLVMGDALAITLLHSRGFSKTDFALRHPGGSLGRKLLLKAKDLMHTGDKIPSIQLGATLNEALIEMNHKRLGMTTITSETKELLGIFTDGDVRRSLAQPTDIFAINIDSIMTRKPTTITAETLATNALSVMNDKKITTLVITDEKNQVKGIIHMHDILNSGIL